MNDNLYEVGREAAIRIWADEPDAPFIVDSRDVEFAAGVMAGLTACLRDTSGLMRRVVEHAAAAAEDLNVEAFQGLVEVLQNADDLGARNVRIALSDLPGERKLLIVHDGAPVTCHHVLAMTLPYLTTKTGDADQKGRFGIGLKTLRRISQRISIHSAPYHFSADGLDLVPILPVSPIPGFYDPASDTLLELELLENFAPGALEEWFEAWDEDGLLFLKSVRRFGWHDSTGGEKRAKSINPGAWEELERWGAATPLSRRRVNGLSGGWTVYRADVATPEGMDRSHKATGPTTAISIAIADHDHPAGLFIGFRTRVPVTLPFSVEAQFDPSTTRESLIDNRWNKWLIKQCGDVLKEVGLTLLRTDPKKAWGLIAVNDEGVGLIAERWPRTAFDEMLELTRRAVAASGQVLVDGELVGLDTIAYESDSLEGLLADVDLRQLIPGASPLTDNARDDVGRWRPVLQALGVSTVVGTSELVSGFEARVFADKELDWWIEAAARLTAYHPDQEIFGIPCWRTDQNAPAACLEKGSTARPLLIGEPLSDFSRRWSLIERLHDRYGEINAGAEALRWLHAHAAVASLVDAADELEAFAEAYREIPIPIEDIDLRILRDRFDLLTDRRAEPLGPKVGAALLLDGFVFRSGKRTEVKVSPRAAYLSRTLDSDHPYWPDAAGDLPGIAWLAASYEERLKTGATRASRKRADGTISRGARKFLMLLGAACSPRLMRTETKYGGGPLRTQELRGLGAEFVEHDFTSPDLDRVLASLERASRKDRKVRGPALIKALSRYWDTYAACLRAPAFHMAIKYAYHRGEVTAEWLCRLHEVRWVVVGTGELSSASQAVIRTTQTLMLYPASACMVGVSAEEIRPAFAAAVKLITDVRASDLVGLLEQFRAAPDGFDPIRVQQVYRSLAKLCPNPVAWNSKVGDLTVGQLRQRFAAGEGLIWIPASAGPGGRWRRPDELFVGKDIFHDPERFVPGGPSCTDLWGALAVRWPDLDDCIRVLRGLASNQYSTAVEAVLIDVYRYIEPLVAKADKRQRERLRLLPVGAGGTWSTIRPVFHVQDRELRGQLAGSRPDLRFWLPPCDTNALPNVCAALGLTACAAKMSVQSDERAAEQGELIALRFQRCVDHLSNELARNDPVTRERLAVPWAELRGLSLFVYARPFEVAVSDHRISVSPVYVKMQAVLQTAPLRLHVSEEALSQRESCGRAIASLFPGEAQRRVEAEWVASWVASANEAIEVMQMASDEELAKALEDRAAATMLLTGVKIKVTPPASRAAAKLRPRRLKTLHGGISAVIVVEGSSPKVGVQVTKPLATAPPAPVNPPARPAPSTGLMEYDSRDLEQRGWEILQQVLNASDAAELVDFRKRHAVGADGVIDWKTFVELKATGRGPQGSVEMSASEFERAKERGLDFMLALVSGLEEGERTEIRLILDPANRAAVRPIGAVRLVGLADVPAVVLQLSDVDAGLELSES